MSDVVSLPVSNTVGASGATTDVSAYGPRRSISAVGTLDHAFGLYGSSDGSNWYLLATIAIASAAPVPVPIGDPELGDVSKYWKSIRTVGTAAITAFLQGVAPAVDAGASQSLTTRVSTEESTRASADTSLTTRVSTEESTRASADTSLTTRVSTEESTRTSADLSLTTRVSTEESTRASADTSLTTRVSTEEALTQKGTDTLSSGTVTVAATLTASSRILLTMKDPGAGAITGFASLDAPVGSRNTGAGTFVVNAIDDAKATIGTAACTFDWEVIG